MDSWTQYNTAQYNTVQYKKQYNTIQYSTRQLAWTPQQLKPFTVGPFSVYTYNYIQISGMYIETTGNNVVQTSTVQEWQFKHTDFHVLASSGLKQQSLFIMFWDQNSNYFNKFI